MKLAAFKKRNESCMHADEDTLFITNVMGSMWNAAPVRPQTMRHSHRGSLIPSVLQQSEKRESGAAEIRHLEHHMPQKRSDLLLDEVNEDEEH